MRIGRFELTLHKKQVPTGYTPSSPGGWGWWPLVREPFAGAWQRNLRLDTANVLTFSAVYACVSLIMNDIGKLRIALVRLGADGIWEEVQGDSPFWPVLRKPNHYQTRIKFYEQWMASKLLHGNTYVLKARDNRGIVTGLYVLDPTRVRPLVAPDGSVFYQLSADNLSGVSAERTVVPASEIIHDVMNAFYHPLCGVSPITACGLAALQGLNVQNHSALFFEQGANPGGVLTAPGSIDDETAKRLERHWNENYGGENAGKVAVLGNGLKFEQMTMSAVDAQLIDQLKWTAENVCTAFHVPPFMIGVAPVPQHSNVQALTLQYYSQCLQNPIESIELLQDEGLGLDRQSPEMGTEFDLEQLLRMDSATQYKTYGDGIRGGLLKPNEGRRKLNLPPVTGGDTPYLQHQDYSLSALAKRDAMDDPFGLTPPAASVSSAADGTEKDMLTLRVKAQIAATKQLADLARRVA